MGVGNLLTNQIGEYMNKHAVLFAALLGVSGSALAATNVTLYGRLDIGYEVKDVKGQKDTVTQEGKDGGNTRLGVKGQEDLGNGYAATFQLEGRFDGDTGSKTVNRTFFDRESTVGLKTPYGHIRMGRSYSAMDQAIGFIDVGRRYSSVGTYDFVKGVKSRHSNAFFYNHKIEGFSFGGDITTKGGYNDGLKTVGGVDNVAFSDEGAPGSKVAYGLFAKYQGNGLEAGVGYQDDGVRKSGSIRKQWGVGVAYTIDPVTFGLSYSAGKDDVVGSQGKIKNYGGYISGKLTPNDTLMAFYRRANYTNTVGTVKKTDDKTTRYGIGYVHALSKRTSIYADVARQETKAMNGVKTEKFTGWDIALRHNF